MPPRIFLLIFLVCGLLSPAAPSLASDNFIFRGQVVDTANNPVSGAEVYVFDSVNVKRPADFISNRTAVDGYYRVELPAGHYWTMAVKRSSGATFGPLGKDDKHSGEPVDISPDGKKDLIRDFTVMDLREAARANRKRSASVFRISGRIFNKEGRPVKMAYVIADKKRQPIEMPRYFSTWTGEDGLYVLYLPEGSFFMGAFRDFPPTSDYIDLKEVGFKGDTEGNDLVLPEQP